MEDVKFTNGLPTGMVVKSVRGRRRYIVYTVPEETGRNEMLESLSTLMSEMPDLKVITSFGGKAIVRCSPAEIETVSSTMKERYPYSESLLTSGTLRTIRDAYPELKVPQKKKR